MLAPSPRPRLLHGLGPSAWEFIALAARRGYDTRTGFEDTLALPDGSPAEPNAALLDAAWRIVAHATRGAAPERPLRGVVAGRGSMGCRCRLPRARPISRCAFAAARRKLNNLCRDNEYGNSLKQVAPLGVIACQRQADCATGLDADFGSRIVFTGMS